MLEQIGWKIRRGIDQDFVRVAHILQQSSIVNMDFVCAREFAKLH